MVSWSQLRSTVSGNIPTTGQMANGHLAVQLADRRIFTSNGSAVFDALTNVNSTFTIYGGGANVLYVGNSTINAVVNSTSLKITSSTANLTIFAANSIQANGSYFLNGNGSWVIVSAGSSVAGSNTFVQFNDSGSMNGTAGMVFDKTANNLSVANTIIVPTPAYNDSSTKVSTTSFVKALAAPCLHRDCGGL